MKRIIWGLTVSVLAAGSADAALLSRAGGQAYYDTALDITWLADANYAQTSGYDSDGLMYWSQAQSWIGSLNAEGGGAGHLGTNTWRLPLTAQPDASCSFQLSGLGYGSGCTGSEMGHLKNVDGITSSAPSPFSNVQPDYYWSGTSYAPDPGHAWVFHFGNGSDSQSGFGKSSSPIHAWVVSPGDAAVPAPGALWLFGAGMAALGAKLTRRARGAGTVA